MSPLGTWVLGLAFVGMLAWAAWAINLFLDSISERAHRRRITDPTPIYRREAGMDALKRIHDEQLPAPALVEAFGLDPDLCGECGEYHDDGVSGQDRESYTDDQDRESYVVRRTDGVVDRDDA